MSIADDALKAILQEKGYATDDEEDGGKTPSARLQASREFIAAIASKNPKAVATSFKDLLEATDRPEDEADEGDDQGGSD